MSINCNLLSIQIDEILRERTKCVSHESVNVFKIFHLLPAIEQYVNTSREQHFANDRSRSEPRRHHHLSWTTFKSYSRPFFFFKNLQTLPFRFSIAPAPVGVIAINAFVCQTLWIYAVLIILILYYFLNIIVRRNTLL